MKILFWNTNNNLLINQAIYNIVCKEEIDILALAEYAGNGPELLRKLAASDIRMTQYAAIGCKNIAFFGNIDNVQPGTQDSRYSVQIINNEYILCCIHLPSQLHNSSEARAIIIRRIIHDVLQHEATLNTKKSILLGDFNEDPYDTGCLNASSFHALPSADDALRERRQVLGEFFEMFYNPMWNFFGDFSSPPGTYYHTNSDAVTPFWHMFDQVLIRPCLIRSFAKESLRIDNMK